LIDHGKVIELRGHDAVVEFSETGACVKCGACLSAGKGKMIALALNSLNAKVGSQVEVEILPRFVIGASFLVFMLPLLFLIAGYFVGVSLFPHNFQQNAGIITSAIFFMLSWFLIKAYDLRIKGTGRFKRRIVKILS
jgi:sigma-E factor negative regulatory protein RseC